MTYALLSENLRNVLYYSFETRLKALMLFGLLFFSFIYLFYMYPKQKPTPFFVVGWSRVIMWALSWAIVGLFPLMLGLLSPEFTLGNLVNIMIYPYLIYLLIFLMLLVVDVFYNALPLIVKLAGFDMTSPRVNRVYQELKKFSKRVL